MEDSKLSVSLFISCIYYLSPIRCIGWVTYRKALHCSRGLHSRSCPAADPTRFLAKRITFPNKTRQQSVSGAIWTGAGGLTLSRSRRPFRTAYVLYSSTGTACTRLICMRCTHKPVLRFICEVCAQHAHNDAQSRLSTSGEYTARRQNRQVVYE